MQQGQLHCPSRCCHSLSSLLPLTLLSPTAPTLLLPATQLKPRRSTAEHCCNQDGKGPRIPTVCDPMVFSVYEDDIQAYLRGEVTKEQYENPADVSNFLESLYEYRVVLLQVAAMMVEEMPGALHLIAALCDESC